MKKKVSVGTALIVTVALFIIVIIITKLFKLEELPIQTVGVLFGGVITALITYFLLIGQTQAEENKEKNVKVFEEKSARFNTFIDKLWEIWDDRIVDLGELNELIKIVSRDIILYSKPETVNKILSNLIEIAALAKPDKTDRKDAEVTKKIQQNIFNIINELAKEIDLGGEIKPDIRSKLNQLEEMVVPFLIQRDFKKGYIENFIKTILENDDVDIKKIEYKNNYLWCQVKDSNVYLRIGPLEREITQHTQFCFYVEFWGNRNYQKYRDASKGYRKDLLRGSNWWFTNPVEFINFNNFEEIEKEYNNLNNSQDYNNNLANKAIELYKAWKFEGKNVEEIIDECEAKNHL
jgi:hypothetical protein